MLYSSMPISLKEPFTNDKIKRNDRLWATLTRVHSRWTSPYMSRDHAMPGWQLPLLSYHIYSLTHGVKTLFYAKFLSKYRNHWLFFDFSHWTFEIFKSISSVFAACCDWQTLQISKKPKRKMADCRQNTRCDFSSVILFKYTRDKMNFGLPFG